MLGNDNFPLAFLRHGPIPADANSRAPRIEPRPLTLIGPSPVFESAGPRHHAPFTAPSDACAPPVSGSARRSYAGRRGSPGSRPLDVHASSGRLSGLEKGGSAMARTLSALGFAALSLIFAASGGAQPVGDHLKCYKVRDPQAKTTYTADLGGLTPEPGCTIKVPAVMACVPSTKTNVHPTPPATGGTGTPNAFGCYKIKCLNARLPALQLNDQFGIRSVKPRRSCCARLSRRRPQRRSPPLLRPPQHSPVA